MRIHLVIRKTGEPQLLFLDLGVYQEPGANLINERNTNYLNNTPTQNQSYEQIYQPWIREYGGTKDRRNPSTR